MSVPEVLIAGVGEGDSVTVTFDAVPEQHFGAHVTEVGVTSGGFATTFPVTVRLGTSNPDIRAGMAAEVAFTFRTGDDRERFFVPVVAVGEDREGRFVYVVEPIDSVLGRVRRRSVRVGELTSDGLEILTGLADGEEVVTAGTSKIADGMTVRTLRSAQGDA